MPAKQISINLLGSQDLEHTPWGRMVSWATTYGRYIMITTEIIVLLAFISRFSLDRKLTDLSEELTQKLAIVEANVDLEKDIRSLQANLATIKQVSIDQDKPVNLVTSMETLLPSDVYLTSFELTPTRLTLAAVARTTEGFSQFLANAQATKLLSNVTLGDINRGPEIGIEFLLTADTDTKKPIAQK